MINDLQTLQAAKLGYQHMIAALDETIAQLTRKSPASEPFLVDKPHRTMSPASRKAIAEAQRKRRAAERAGKKTPTLQAKPGKPSRREISKAGKERIAAATRKRWAEFRAKKAEAAEKGKPKTASAGA